MIADFPPVLGNGPRIQTRQKPLTGSESSSRFEIEPRDFATRKHIYPDVLLEVLFVCSVLHFSKSPYFKS